METIYKAVSCDDHDRLTSLVWSIKEMSCVMYGVDRWSYPAWKGSYLMAFDTYKNAKRYAGYMSQTRIYKAETPQIIKPICGMPAPHDDLAMDFWKKFNEGKCSWLDYDWMPIGTVWCPSIKLVELIQ